jgi:hypothetical protein
MTEFLSAYNRRFKTSQVTPNRIQQHLERGDDDLTANDVWLMMPSEIVSLFYSNTKRPKDKNIKKFIKSLDILLEDYKPMDLLKIDVDCVNRNGSINEDNLRKILTEGTGI